MKFLARLYAITMVFSTNMFISCCQQEEYETQKSRKNHLLIKEMQHNDSKNSLIFYDQTIFPKNQLCDKRYGNMFDKIKLVKITNPTSFWHLFEQLQDDDIELINNKRAFILDAFKNEHLYSLEEEGLLVNKKTTLIPCLCVKKESIENVAEIIWVHKDVEGKRYREILLKKLNTKEICNTACSTLSSFTCNYHYNDQKTKLKKIDTAQDFWCLFDALIDDNNAKFIGRKDLYLQRFKEGKLYGLTTEATMPTDNSIHTQLLPCLSVIRQADINTNEYVETETEWVYAKLKKKRLSIQMLYHLNPWNKASSS